MSDNVVSETGPPVIGEVKLRRERDWSNLCDGDHLAVNIGETGLWHHGIYNCFIDDKGCTKHFVYHVTGDGKDQAAIVCDQFFDFYANRTVLFVLDYPEGGRTAEKIIAKAKKLYENKASWGKYSTLSNNCEHFATYCKAGKKKSAQAEVWVTMALKAVVNECRGTKSSGCLSSCC
ncbi:uncharacterized protein LOC134177463 [Corticium candelabrum]|uniref:uncharacterized protein LOC134177463 n=1 Tax=Corticium candelabrum TaxID=121492 RepID=UPI002E26A798|nr:uncharacterized protein LOC134177463 [Corticium candelabrum]